MEKEHMSLKIKDFFSLLTFEIKLFKENGRKLCGVLSV
jgi:hypothetical protein